MLLGLAGCATRELPAHHAESSPLSEDAAVPAPRSVTTSLDDEPTAEPADAGLAPDGSTAPDHSHHHHHHQHGGDGHAR